MSNKQLKILRCIKKYKSLHKVLKKCNYTLEEYIEFQENFPDGSYIYMMFSDKNFDEDTFVYLTPFAEGIVDPKNNNRIQFLFPLIISLCALALSIAVFIKSFY